MQNPRKSLPLTNLSGLILKNFKKICLGVAFVVIVFFILFLRWEAFDSARINDWIQRDIDRAFSLVDGDYFPLAGPELSITLHLSSAILLIISDHFPKVFRLFDCPRKRWRRNHPGLFD